MHPLETKLTIAKLEDKEILTEKEQHADCDQDCEEAGGFECRVQDVPLHHCGPDRELGYKLDESILLRIYGVHGKSL